jgi:hypothetical protein
MVSRGVVIGETVQAIWTKTGKALDLPLDALGDPTKIVEAAKHRVVSDAVDVFSTALHAITTALCHQD